MTENNKGYAIVGENGQYTDPVYETRAEAEAHRGPAQDVVAVEYIDQAIAYRNSIIRQRLITRAGKALLSSARRCQVSAQ